MAKHYPQLKHIPTKKLKEIIDNQGISHHGKDYEESLDEMAQILWKRQEKLNSASNKEIETNSETLQSLPISPEDQPPIFPFRWDRGQNAYINLGEDCEYPL